MTDPTTRLERAVYDALRDFQQTADWPQLRLAQMRQHLAEAIARDVALTPGAMPAAPVGISVNDLAHALDNSTPYPVELTSTVARYMAERLPEMLAVSKRPEHPVWQPEEQSEPGEQPQPEDPASAVSLPPADQTACTCFVINDGGVHAASCVKRVADQAVLESLSDTLYDALYAITPFAEKYFADEGEGLRNAVRAVLEQAAVLPATTDQTAEFELRGDTAIRAAVLREAADRMSQRAAALTEDLHDLAYFVAKDRLREAEILDREAAGLRRMADETPAAETTADKAARLGMTPEEYRAHRHLAAVRQIRVALPGLYATTGLRVETALTEPAAETHVCDNCGGVDPDTCFNNPHRPPEQCPRSEADGYGLQCQKPAGHNLCTFEEQPAAGARQDGAQQ